MMNICICLSSLATMCFVIKTRHRRARESSSSVCVVLTKCAAVIDIEAVINLKTTWMYIKTFDKTSLVTTTTRKEIAACTYKITVCPGSGLWSNMIYDTIHQIGDRTQLPTKMINR